MAGKKIVDSNILNSLKFDGKPLTNRYFTGTDLGSPLIIENLQSNRIVEDILKKKCTEIPRFGFEPKDAITKSQVVVKSPVYSRGLVLLFKPRMVNEGRFGGSGKVILRGIFGADGCVKGALVLRGSTKDSDAVKAAVLAAYQIKFLPAEIDGKPVESYKEIEYSFATF